MVVLIPVVFFFTPMYNGFPPPPRPPPPPPTTPLLPQSPRLFRKMFSADSFRINKYRNLRFSIANFCHSKINNC